MKSTVWKSQFDILQNYFKNIESGIKYVISPFINSKVLVDLLSSQRNKDVVVVTSWRSDHLLTGVSSLDLYNAVRENGWTLLINSELHAKIYSNNLTSAWIGSANVTTSGLDLAEKSNLEVLTFLEYLNQNDRVQILHIIGKSQLVNDKLFEQYEQWMKNQVIVEPLRIEDLEISYSIGDEFFLISQLPASESPVIMWQTGNNSDSKENAILEMEHDLALYGVSPLQEKEIFLEKLREEFFMHPFIKSFDKLITKEGIFFGESKKWIQNNCINVPMPYSRELTSQIQSLYSWFTDLAPEIYDVDIPKSHSQRLRRVRNEIA